MTAEYGMLPRATHTRSDREAAKGKQSGRTQEIQRLIGRSMRNVFDLKALGERTISSTATCCRPTAAPAPRRSPAPSWRRTTRIEWGSWLLAGKKIAASPIRGFVAAVSVGIVAARRCSTSNTSKDSACDTDMNVVMTGRGGFVEVQGTAEACPSPRRDGALLAWPTRASANWWRAEGARSA